MVQENSLPARLSPGTVKPEFCSFSLASKGRKDGLPLVGTGGRTAHVCNRKQHLLSLRDRVIFFRVWLSNRVSFYWQPQLGAL